MFKYIKILISMAADESQRWRYVRATPVLKLIPDKYYLKKWYKFNTGKELDLENPQTFSEKLQWLKMYNLRNKNPLYTLMVDKYGVKNYVSEKLGKEYVIPVVGGPWEHFSDINFDELPEQFVLKVTHDSGGTVICRDKSAFDRNKARNKLEYSLKHNYFYYGREWQYKNVKPMIFAEKYMEDKDSIELRDYKFYCFNGQPKFLYISQGLEDHSTARINFVDLSWNKTVFQRTDYVEFDVLPEKPKHFEKMIEFSERLAGDIPFVRIDFYEINNELYFGEITFFPGGGMVELKPPEWDKILGDYIELPDK